MYRSLCEDTPNNTFIFLSITHSSECDYYNTLIVYGKEIIPTQGKENRLQLNFVV
jgi:hypothetical protein